MFLTILNYLKSYIGLCLLLLVATHTLAHGKFPLRAKEAFEALQQNSFEIKSRENSIFLPVENAIIILRTPFLEQAAIRPTGS